MPNKDTTKMEGRMANSDVEVQSELPQMMDSSVTPYGADEVKKTVKKVEIPLYLTILYLTLKKYPKY